MGIKKLKRKASEDDDVPLLEEAVKPEEAEPPKKKHKGLSTEEFIGALQGADGPEGENLN